MQSVKIVLVGDLRVGKTCFFVRLTADRFPDTLYARCLDNYSTEYMYKDKPIKLNLWDTNQTGDFEKLTELSYRETDVFLIFYDVTKRRSLENCIKWLEITKKHAPYSQRLLVGTELDTYKDYEKRFWDGMYKRTPEWSRKLHLLKCLSLVKFSKCTNITPKTYPDVIIKLILEFSANTTRYNRDLFNHERPMKTNDILEIQSKIQCSNTKVLQCSAFTGENCKEVLQEAITIALEPPEKKSKPCVIL